MTVFTASRSARCRRFGSRARARVRVHRRHVLLLETDVHVGQDVCQAARTALFPLRCRVHRRQQAAVRAQQAHCAAQVAQDEVAGDDSLLLQLVFADAAQPTAQVLKDVKLH